MRANFQASHGMLIILYFQALEDQTFAVNLDCQVLKEYDEHLYHQLVSFPQELISLFDLVVDEIVKQIIEQQDPDQARKSLAKKVEVRPFNLDEVKALRTLDPDGTLPLCVSY